MTITGPQHFGELIDQLYNVFESVGGKSPDVSRNRSENYFVPSSSRQ